MYKFLFKAYKIDGSCEGWNEQEIVVGFGRRCEDKLQA